METIKKISAQKAIKNHCKGCIYDSEEKGTWLQQIEACTITKCELYNHRPLTSKTRRINEEKRLELLSPTEREIIENRRDKHRKILLDLHKNK